MAITESFPMPSFSLLAPHAKISADPSTAKIHTYTTDLLQGISALFLLYQTGDLSAKLHEIAQLTLSFIACTGYTIAFLIGVGGFTKMAIITVILSSANFVGAYIAYETTLQLSLAKSTDKLEKQVDKLEKQVDQFEKQNQILEKHIVELGLINTELKTTSEDLKNTNQELKTQVGLFEEQNALLRENVSDFQRANKTLHGEITLLRGEVDILARCNKELKKTSKTLQREVSLFSAQNEQFRSLAEHCKIEAEELLCQNQKYSQTQAELLNQFKMQISHSDLLWNEMFKQLGANNLTHAQIIEQHTQALAQLHQPELREALKKDIQEASKEFRELQQEVKSLLKEIQEKNTFLETLKKEHQEILDAKRTLFEQEKALFEANQKQIALLGAHVAKLTNSGATQ